MDAAALVALDRNERAMWARLKHVAATGEVAATHAGIVGQVWRGGARQARLGQALSGIDVRPLDEQLARSSGELLARTGSTDVIDAALVMLSDDGDDIVTSDLTDFEMLASASGRHLELIRP